MTYERYFRLRNVAPETYDDYRIPSWMRNVLPPDRAAAILDIGCGWGQTLRDLGNLGYGNSEGIDVSGEAVAHCRKSGLNVSRIGSIEEYCREQAHPRFDFVVMSHVVEHIEKPKVIPTLAAIRERLLADGGSLLVLVPNAQSHTGCYWAYEDFTHETIFTAGSLVFVLRAAGFDSVEFLDPKGIASSGRLVKILRIILLGLYSANVRFWNLVTSSSFHRPSPVIFTFDIKALAKKT